MMGQPRGRRNSRAWCPEAKCREPFGKQHVMLFDQLCGVARGKHQRVESWSCPGPSGPCPQRQHWRSKHVLLEGLKMCPGVGHIQGKGWHLLSVRRWPHGPSSKESIRCDDENW